MSFINYLFITTSSFSLPTFGHCILFDSFLYFSFLLSVFVLFIYFHMELKSWWEFRIPSLWKFFHVMLIQSMKVFVQLCSQLWEFFFVRLTNTSTGEALDSLILRYFWEKNIFLSSEYAFQVIIQILLLIIIRRNRLNLSCAHIHWGCCVSKCINNSFIPIFLLQLLKCCIVSIIYSHFDQWYWLLLRKSLIKP